MDFDCIVKHEPVFPDEPMRIWTSPKCYIRCNGGGVDERGLFRTIDWQVKYLKSQLDRVGKLAKKALRKAKKKDYEMNKK